MDEQSEEVTFDRTAAIWTAVGLTLFGCFIAYGFVSGEFVESDRKEHERQERQAGAALVP